MSYAAVFGIIAQAHLAKPDIYFEWSGAQARADTRASMALECIPCVRLLCVRNANEYSHGSSVHFWACFRANSVEKAQWTREVKLFVPFFENRHNHTHTHAHT